MPRLSKGASSSCSSCWMPGPLLTRRLEAVCFLWQSGENAEEHTDRRTALYAAAEKGHVEVVKLLINRGAYVNLLGTDNDAPLHVAVVNNKLECVRLLIDRGAFVNKGDNRTLVCYVTELTKHVELNTPLHLAARLGFGDIVILLLERGADVLLKNVGTETNTW